MKKENLNEVFLKQKLEEMFVHKDCNLKNVSSLAALITAASKMAMHSGIVNEFDTIDELIDLYNVEEETKKLIGMSPQYVKSNIGYSVDFMDFNISKRVYDANKFSYDDLYKRVAKRMEERSNSKQL